MRKGKLKQVILVRTDIRMGKGKIASQVAHASVDAVLKTLRRNPFKVMYWRKEGMKKSVLKVSSAEHLIKLRDKAEMLGLTTSLIIDAGRTQIRPNTMTCLAIGPDAEDRIDKVTGDLKLL